MNTLTIIGNVGREPEMTYTPDGTAVTKFAVADNLPKKKDGTQDTQWFNCVAFGKVAEILTQYVHKGDKIFLQGSFQARSYTAKDGSKGTSLDLHIEKFQFLTAKAPENGNTPASPEGNDFPF